MSQPVGILTGAVRRAAQERLTQLGVDITSHAAQGLEAHDDHQLLNTPYLDSNGNTLGSRTLRIGIFRLNTNTKVVVDIPIVA